MPALTSVYNSLAQCINLIGSKSEFTSCACRDRISSKLLLSSVLSGDSLFFTLFRCCVVSNMSAFWLQFNLISVVLTTSSSFSKLYDGESAKLATQSVHPCHLQPAHSPYLRCVIHTFYMSALSPETQEKPLFVVTDNLNYASSFRFRKAAPNLNLVKQNPL